jgi:sugar O-acyltransferase (sialic acid O-acetyltransferase NeuD family)
MRFTDAVGQPYILWGSAGHAKVLAEIIALSGGTVAALFDNDPSVASCLPGVPIYHGDAAFGNWLLSQATAARGFAAALAIGGARGRDRVELASRMKKAGLSLPLLVHPSASVSASAQFDDGCQVLAKAVVAADVSMGSACIVNHGANVDHECTLGAGVHIAPGAVLCGCVHVSDNAMIGAGAVVLPRVRIGRDAIIGAGGVVTRDVPDRAIVVGNPAKFHGSLR